jgi:hypothetical protein
MIAFEIKLLNYFPQECCNMPRFKDVDKVRKIFEELRTKEPNLNGPIIECVSFQLEIS